MPGVRVPSSNRRVDVVVIAAHYGPDRQLEWVQAYERRGRVWGDKVLLDRRALIERLQRKQRVLTGAPRSIPGDFELGPALGLRRDGPAAAVVVGSKSTDPGDLGVPVL